MITVCSTGWSVWSTYHRRSQVPQRTTWREAAELVKREWREGDRVTWYPAWAEEARLALHGLEPLQLPHQGDVDLGRASRLWVLGAFGHDGTSLIKDPALRLLQTLELVRQEQLRPSDSGPVSISLLQIKSHRVVSDVLRDLEDVNRVEVTRRRLNSSREDLKNKLT